MRTSPFRVALALIVLHVIANSSRAIADSAKPAMTTEPRTAPAGNRKLEAELEKIRKKQKIPALAAAVVRDGKLIDIAAAGFRSGRKGPRVTPDDRFHLGSCTKSMTATLCAILVEQGKLRWDMTVAEAFANIKDKIDPSFHSVTLEQLLCHRGGLPEDRRPDLIVFPQIMALSGDMQEQRREMVSIVLGRAPATDPGSTYAYSNFGFAIAGAMCEVATAESYESLMKKHLFNPLDMPTAGFGAPGIAGKVDEPRGHSKMLSWYSPIEPGFGADNPAVLAPCGTAHASLRDWAKYAALHLDALNGTYRLLKKETFERLHSDSFKQDYGFGWLFADRDWAGGPILAHDGSNGRWYATIILAPKKNAAFLVATNAASEPAIGACQKAVRKMQRLFLNDGTASKD